MKPSPYLQATSVLIALLVLAVSARAQKQPIATDGTVAPIASPPQLLKVPVNDQQGYAIQHSGQFAGTFGGVCAHGCCAGAQSRIGSCRHACQQYNNPARHYRYLKGIYGAAAQYTHNWNAYRAQQTPWNGSYYHTQWGAPVALVVPPTAALETQWSWGAGRTTTTPLYHQFVRPDSATAESAGPQFQATPWWPSHTSQFGVYYIRGPW